jgi:hypothetical protein
MTRTRSPFLFLWLCLAFPAVAMAQTTVTVTVTSSGTAVKDAFVALVGTGSTITSYGGTTSASGVATIPNVLAGTYTVRAQAPGTRVGTATDTLVISAGAPAASAAVSVTSSGSVFAELGAYGSGNEAMLADGGTGVFYLMNTRSIPSVYRTGDYGGTWRPVTLSNDDPTNGMDGSSTMKMLATSGRAGEVASAGGTKVWYSRDFGTTWASIPGPAGVNLSSFGNPPSVSLYWAHSATSIASVIFLVTNTQEIYYADTTEATPAFVAMGANSYKTATTDLITVANSGTGPVFVVLSTAGGTAGTVSLYPVDSTPSRTDTPTTIAGAIPTLATDGTTALTGSDAFWIRMAGSADGRTVGSYTAPRTILVYSVTSNNVSANAKMTSCLGSSPCTSPTTTRFLTVNDAVDATGKFSGGSFGGGSTCAANREANAIGSISPLGTTGSLGSCWLTVNGSNLDVRAVANINNNTAMVYDAGYNGVDNFVVLSSDGQHGAVKSAKMSVEADRAGAFNDPGLNRPLVPRFPQIATGGIGQTTGGTSITGLNGALIRQVVFKPGDATTLAAVMDFGAGGRAIGSSDSGATWSTLFDIGGVAIEWWNGATAGTQWIMSGSAGHGNWLLGRRITSFSSATNLTGVTNTATPPQSLGPTDFGEVTTIIGNAGFRAITGIPGTDYAIVATYDGQVRKLHALKFALTPGPSQTPFATLTELASLPETGTGSANGGGATRMAYCGTESSVAASAQGKLFVAMGGLDFGNPSGRLRIYSGIGNAANTNNFSSGITSMDAFPTGDFRDIAVNCATGTVWVARHTPTSPASVGILKSVAGGDFNAITPPSGADPRAFQQMMVIDFNKVVPRQVVALNRNGDILRSNDDGATWTIVNDTSTASCVVTTSPCGRSFGAEPGDFTFPPAPSSSSLVADSAPMTDAVSGATPGVMGSAAGLFAVSSGSTSGLSNPVMALDAPTFGATLTATQSFPVSGWAVDRNVGAGAGVDDIHVYAYPLPSGTAVFLGQATFGSARTDVGGVYGSQFTNSGFSLTATGLPAGNYRIVAFAQSVVTGAFTVSAFADVTVSAAASNPFVAVDTPSSGASLGQAFTVSGWAVDLAATTGTGIDTIHMYAYELANGALGAATFLGVGTTGVSRPDVGAAFGSTRFNASGYTLAVSSALAPGTYRVVVFGRSTVTGAFTAASFADITVAADPQMALDAPGDNTTQSQPFAVSGWAVDRGAATGAGVSTVHVYAFPVTGGVITGPAVFVGLPTMGGSRPDIGGVYGAQFTNSGFTLNASGLTPGQYMLVVYAQSTVTGTFNQARYVTITVQ